MSPNSCLQYSVGSKTTFFRPSCSYNCPKVIRTIEDLGRITTPAERMHQPLWFLLDECQHTYSNPTLWEMLSRNAHNVFVIAAGSFGSHSDSHSHSPPREIINSLRMSLFDSKKEPPEHFLAFTEGHLTDYLNAHNKISWKNHIVRYASPTLMGSPLSDLGLHPGVIANLVSFIQKRVCRFHSYDLQVLMIVRRIRASNMTNKGLFWKSSLRTP